MLLEKKTSQYQDQLLQLFEQSPEGHAFWQFLQREFHLENAAACLSMLDEKAARKQKSEMNPVSLPYLQ